MTIFYYKHKKIKSPQSVDIVWDGLCCISRNENDIVTYQFPIGFVVRWDGKGFVGIIKCVLHITVGIGKYSQFIPHYFICGVCLLILEVVSLKIFKQRYTIKS